ncbi:MAG TPA: PQQ-binding-like beta-propeller repeat protein [Polyangiaceae bacterium]|nr:PQQ-binding-like beta-propeller repeat protein [Polyangiaceae bacterium]
MGLPTIGVGLTALGLLCGCSSLRESAFAEGPTWLHRPGYALQLLYRESLVAESRRTGEPYERGRPTIDPVGMRIFVGSSDRGLYAVRAQDGAVLWRFETLAAVQSEPLYDPGENVVYFGSNDGALYKLEASSGRMLWRFASNAEVARKPVLVAGRLVFVNANDTVVVVNAQSGERLWSQHRTPALGMEISGHSGVLVLGNSVFVAYSDGNVMAYELSTGHELWEPVDLGAQAEQALGQIPKYLDADATPEPCTIDGAPAVLVGSYSGGVTALLASTGAQLWSNSAVLGVTDLSIWHQAAHTDANDGNVYPEHNVLIVSTGSTGIWGLDPKTGSEIWHRDLPEGGVSAPAFIAGAALVGTSDHGLYLLSPLQGAVIDGIHTQTGFSMAPAAYGQRAYVLSDSGDFLALSVASPAWHPEQ